MGGYQRAPPRAKGVADGAGGARVVARAGEPRVACVALAARARARSCAVNTSPPLLMQKVHLSSVAASGPQFSSDPLGALMFPYAP